MTQNMVSTLRRLALQAGAQIMEIYTADDFDMRQKADDSPVTAADLAADKIISAGLCAAFPDIALVTEEQAQTHHQSSDSFFIVDPLDGTKEFIHRRGDFTVNIAYVVDGRPVLGVVYAPAKGRLFYVDDDGQSIEEFGLFEDEQRGLCKPIRVTEPHGGGLIVIASKSHSDAATADYIAQYDVGSYNSAGSSLKFCLIATGEADLYPRLGRTMEWDTAAGHAVLLGAGGRVVRFDTHIDLTYGKLGYENPQFIAAADWVVLQKSNS